MNAINAVFQRQAIRRHFSKAAETYLAAAALQKEVEARLLEQADLLQYTPKSILDLGCGPGRAAGLLKKRWPKAEVIALDMALPMLRQVPKHTRFWRPVKCVCADALKLPFKEASFDFIFSNLCLQWVHPLPEALYDIRRVLKPGGLFVFSSFGPDTLLELREAYLAIGTEPAVSPFAAIQQVGAALQDSGFSGNVLERDVFTLHYADVRTLMQELHALGATDARSNRPRGLMGKRRWQALNAAYPICDEHIVSTWEVISAMAFRPEQGPPRFEDDIVAVIDAGQIRRRRR